MNIQYLADQTAAIPTLAQWFRDEWPDHYASRSLADIEAEFRNASSRDRIPIALVAFAGDQLAGTIALRPHALGSQPEGPGLGGLYVSPEHRGTGISVALVEAGVAEAQRLGHSTIYTGTAVAQKLFQRLGWRAIRTVRHGGEDVTLFRIGP